MKTKVVTSYQKYDSQINFEDELQEELDALGTIIIHSVNYSTAFGQFPEENEQYEQDEDNTFIYHSALIMYDEVPSRKVITEKTDK